MSERYPGGIISKTPVVPTTTSAPGIWTLDQQLQAQKAGIWPIPYTPIYIEDVFSTYLYTGNASTQTITNGIDLAGKGGLVWLKTRNQAYSNTLYDTARGVNKLLFSDNTDAQFSSSGYLTNFGSTGFTVGANENTNFSTSNTAVSWTFRKQPKFFDVVTYTGNSTGSRAISHSLGSTPGCVIVKCTSNGGSQWFVWHRSLTAGNNIYLNLAQAEGAAAQGIQSASSTTFTVGTESDVNYTGFTYVAYLFAHNAGGFGLTGTDNVISCGSFTTDGSGNATVNLGYEPQLVIIKTSGVASNWAIFDTMRGMPASGSDNRLFPNLSAAEDTGFGGIAPTATGFNGLGLSGYGLGASLNYIYIAIRRGPMKVPTSGTSVFSPNAVSTDASAVTTNFPVDLSFESPRSGSSNIFAQDRLRGANQVLYTYNTNAESTAAGSTSNFQSNTSVQPSIYGSGTSLIFWNFQRAPSFFDEVCYTGNGTAGATQTHNLGAVPEMMIVKDRNYSGGRPWTVYHSALGATKFTYMNQTTTPTTSSAAWNDTAPTASVFTLGSNSIVNFSGTSYVAYLFATCAGVSKVGSYTGTGALQTINCGFTGGARFVYIHRTDSTGDWYVWDSARGITSGNDPYLLMNSTAAETTGTNYVDTDSTGFKVTAAAPAGLNASGGTYIFLAIA